MIQSPGHAVARYLKTIRLFFSSEARSQAIGWFALLLCLLLTVNALQRREQLRRPRLHDGHLGSPARANS